MTNANEPKVVNRLWKSPGLAVFLSFLHAGWGQIYNGEITKGVVLMVIQLINYVLFFVLIGFPMAFATWLYSMWDANKVAQQWNAQHSG